MSCSKYCLLTIFARWFVRYWELMAETGEVGSLEFAVLTARTSNDEAVNSLQQLKVS